MPEHRYMIFKDNLMQTYKLIVSYDGTDYAGWQSQGDGSTVAEALVKAFVDVFKSQPALRGVSRTDAGVHAMGQVVLLRTTVSIAPDRLAFAWNNRLPDSIVVREAKLVEHDFKLHAKVVEKTYYYHFFTQRPQPFVARYGWYCQKPIDLEKLQKALNVFVGTHDFRSFCTGYDWSDTVRTINSITLEYLSQYDMYRIVVKGPRFLRYMIRRLVGASMQVASNAHINVAILNEVMQQKNPEQTLLNAPAKGLMLYKIRYQEEESNDEEQTLFQLF